MSAHEHKVRACGTANPWYGAVLAVVPPGGTVLFITLGKLKTYKIRKRKNPHHSTSTRTVPVARSGYMYEYRSRGYREGIHVPPAVVPRHVPPKINILIQSKVQSIHVQTRVDPIPPQGTLYYTIEEIPKILNTVFKDYYWPGAYEPR